MNASPTTINEMQQAVRDVVRFHSGLFITQGVITTLLGIAAVILPNIFSVAVELYVGWIFLFSGLTGLVMMLFAPNAANFIWSLLSGALALFAGVLLLWHPIQGVVSLTLLLVAFFIAEGMFQVVVGFSYRSAFRESWGWMIISGIADLVLAGLLIAGWPSTAAWALGLIVGVNFITSGVAMIVVATAVRGALGDVKKTG
ncbi:MULTISPECIES: HdeD family acid-resistance protein [unclassified Mesorhizobium]|uniref:HdeD family acid-resistance protein n=1 Tax=unclassified Mesorhizobium TaxID=325217 RepID=UPI000FCB6466|nr:MULTISPECIES: DUF308 domain-containing protein [unclassified Mesorhizobium]RUW28639.1 HdeD family acid-resistance protein [Mesorhizobium sp. M1E.F.Ca.ET.041.01.1.1]RWD90802.1 MAG: HdeD family acid-resistance protein [Mesorhizobium sp.]RWD92248.1 MAG: HdeD family acid-resistance protein [Mesorhizobium sp.]TIV55524.1 MAG: HdeD family acid-resistance protein [Mesorhizobium sp.]